MACLHLPADILYHRATTMKNTFRCSTVASPHAPRRFFALGAVLAALIAPTLLLTGCGSGGGSNPSPNPSAGPNETVITGRIVDANTGSAGLAGATVQFAGASARTDSNGNFSLTVPRHTAGGSATVIPPNGTLLYPYASVSGTPFRCANSPTFSVTGPFTGGTFTVGTVSVYVRTANTTPNPPCI
jgi:hypothetical protein